ncbi:hypothetical protein HPB52_017187 [Rhipicephalus sanguineus]|uniref:Transcriptional coactivator n=1 Tax=Rhipicephalus sanguineus TaxID=34632 RepID=A0A9D4Q174_RHISA|nr:hypothetical protein HPB52_017187 [Rhipicephalus sanguineus]
MDPEEHVASVPSVKFPKVPSPPDLTPWERVPVYVTHYERPSKLFLRYNLSDHENECIDSTDYYIEEERQHVYEASIGMYCMVVLPEDSSRQALRALVTDVRRNVAGIQVLADVLYIDEGRTDVVALDCVYPMSDYEARDPCRSVACCMRRIRPTLESSCYDLQRLLDNTVPYYYDAIFYGLSDGGVYEVDLFINCPDAPIGMQRQNVARLLVDNGYAEFLDYLRDAALEDVEPTVHVSDHSQQPEREGIIEQNLLERGSINTENGIIATSEICDDYNSPLNSYNVNTDDPGVAAANFSAKTNRICKFFSTQGYCRQNGACVFKHIDAEANSALLHITEPVAECVELKPPEPGSWLLGQMSAYASPNHFYLIFCYGRKTVDRHIMEDGAFSMGETLQSLMDDIQVFCSRGHFLENRLFAKSVGEFVAARSSRDNLWYRAQVVAIGDGDQLKVSFVDFGFCEWLSLNNVRTLDPRFTHLAIQSQLSSLVDTELCDLRDGTGWDKEMCKRFLECVTGETLLIETVSSKQGLLHVKLFFYRDNAIYSVTDFIRNM